MDTAQDNHRAYNEFQGNAATALRFSDLHSIDNKLVSVARNARGQNRLYSSSWLRDCMSNAEQPLLHTIMPSACLGIAQWL